MHSDKYLKIFRIFVALALVISLVLNFTFLSRLNQLEHQVNTVFNNQHNIISDVNGQTSHIQNVLNDIKEEQSWISGIDLDVNTNDFEDGQAEATFEWQVKELQNDSEVVFNYAYGDDSEEYTTLPAKELQQGLFQVKVPFEVDVEPLWEVSLETPDSNTKQEMTKKEMEEHHQNILKYYVSVSYDDMVKSGEIHTEPLGHLGTKDYGIVQTDIYMHKENVSIALISHNVNDSIVVEEAYLMMYKGETLIGEKEIESDDENNPPDQSVRLFNLNQVDRYEDMRLVIKVVYTNGETFKKEVY
ncbi:hypothetical protein [Alkalihalobacillus sp. AL-G]|uniref:hypothetical protein n=1 Tax=Alkalihalobacillus sp. AL-G TaxID=2926399 RepID=UPI00272B6D22|nr:hypothetical protein [Alkalihalobacillus sp. AL-G]WLD93999.1 hypothetical protein MOJ78_03615 [Alkalihalobacillus sp. AL-G]